MRIGMVLRPQLKARWAWMAFPCVAAAAVAAMLLLPQAARGEAPAGHYTADTDTVLDSGTRLYWQRNSDGTARSWDAATAYCQSLPLSGTGWRVPSVKELQSIYDETAAGGSSHLDRTAFPAAATSAHWSSSEDAQDATHAWTVAFSSSSDFVSSVAKSGTALVRCVR